MEHIKWLFNLAQDYWLLTMFVGLFSTFLESLLPVLPLVAIVTINVIQNDGIINHAKNARDEYGKAQVNENTTLEKYLSQIEENLPGGSTGGNGGGDVNSGGIKGFWKSGI